MLKFMGTTSLLLFSLVPMHGATIIDFDSIPATAFFADVVPGGARGPLLTFPGVTFNGGVVLNNDRGGFRFPTTGTNSYATLSGGFPAPQGVTGVITIDFTGPEDFVFFDIENGNPATDPNTYTATAFGNGGALLGSSMVVLNGVSPSAGVQTISLTFSGIRQVTVIRTGFTEPPPVSGGDNIDFAIDTVTFGQGQAPQAPEPSSIFLAGTGIAVALLKGVQEKLRGNRHDRRHYPIGSELTPKQLGPSRVRPMTFPWMASGF